MIILNSVITLGTPGDKKIRQIAAATHYMYLLTSN